ncbi:MAG: efflux RND transporter periplasmic adaptor subunit [Bdellovibrionales bacterium]|nr:efflux RND transporter periplasmic adaptor subunit [Bdellovibrionales bacterium]
MRYSLKNRIVILSLGGFTFILIIWIFGIGQFGKKSHLGLGTVLRQELLQRVTVAGVVIPFKKTIMTAPYNGYVNKLYVSVGDRVKIGDPVFGVVQSLQAGDDPFPLRSPLDGVVVQVEKSEGEYVKEGDQQNFIVRIDDISRLFVVANAPEMDRVKLKTGQEAVVRASAILDRKYKGIIRELSLAAREQTPGTNNQVVEFPIKIEIMDGDEMIKPGMSVVIDVITAKRENVLTLRHEYIRRDHDKYFVILASGDRQDIEVGIQNEQGFEVLSGLRENQQVQQVDFSELNWSE